MNWTISQTVDLSRGYTPVVWPDALMVSGDVGAHTWRLTVLDNGAPVDLSGATITGSFLRADGNTVTVAGAVSGNVASVTLTDVCYAIDGKMKATIKMVKSGATITLAAVIFTVGLFTSGSVIDPGVAYADFQIDASPKGVYADLAALNADPSADVSKIYITLDDGNWCYHNGTTFVAGGVYQATAIADESVTPFKLDGINTDRLYGYSELTITWEVGALTTNGANTVATTRLRFPQIVYVKKGSRIVLVDKACRFNICRFDYESGAFVDYINWMQTDYYFDNDYGIRVSFSAIPEVAIIPSASVGIRIEVPVAGPSELSKGLDEAKDMERQIFGYTLGGLSPSGLWLNDSRRIMTLMEVPLRKGAVVSLSDVGLYKYSCCRFDFDTGALIDYVDWTTKEWVLEKDYLVKFALALKTDADVTLDIAPNLIVKSPRFSSAVVETELNKLRDTSDVLLRMQKITPTWQLGSLVPATGDTQPDTRRYRTSNILPLPIKSRISLVSPDQYKMVVYRYDFNTSAYIDNTGWISNDYVLPGDYGVRVLIAYQDDRAVDTPNITNNIEILRAGFKDGSAGSASRLFLSGADSFTNKVIQLKRRATPTGNVDVLTLLHFSDLHGSVENLETVVAVKAMYDGYIDDVIHTGDGVATYFDDDNPFDSVAASKSILNVIGNHECWLEGDSWYNATDKQVYDKYIAPYVSGWGVTQPQNAANGLCYYYKDYSEAGIRLICLDACHYDAAQNTWFSATLSAANTAGLAVVIATHYPPMSGMTPLEGCTFNTLDRVLGPLSGQAERMDDSAYVAVDSFISEGGEFVCWLSGHTHTDHFGFVNDHSNQTIIIVENAGPYSTHNDSHRLTNTKSQDSFNIIGFDKASKLIKIVRYGNDTDRYMRRKGEMCYNYATKKLVFNA